MGQTSLPNICCCCPKPERWLSASPLIPPARRVPCTPGRRFLPTVHRACSRWQYSEGVMPSCFLNIRLRCWEYSKPRRSDTCVTVSPGGKPVLGKPDDEAADVVACRVAGGLFDYVTEIVGRHAKFVRAILHGRQAKRKLELLVVIIPQQVFEAGQNIGILDFTCGKLAVVETLAKVEGKARCSLPGWRFVVHQASP